MFSIHYNWYLLAASFVIALILGYRQNKIASHLMIYNPLERRLSIFDLQFPGSEYRLSYFLANMSPYVKSKLKQLLLLHYVFIFFSFLAIGTLAQLTAIHAGSKTGRVILLILMFLQPAAFIFQFIDTSVLLKKLKDPARRVKNFKAINILTSASYVIAISAISSAFFSFLYFWFTGLLSGNFIRIFSTIVLLIAALIIVLVVMKSQKEKSEVVKDAERFNEEMQLKMLKR